MNRPENHYALSGLLMAAAMALVLVLADHLIALVPQRYALSGWVLLWSLVFVGLAISAGPLRRVTALVAARIVHLFAQRLV